MMSENVYVVEYLRVGSDMFCVVRKRGLLNGLICQCGVKKKNKSVEAVLR